MKSFSCKNCNANLPVQKSFTPIVKCAYCGLEHLIEGVSEAVVLRDRGHDLSSLLRKKMSLSMSLRDLKLLCGNINEDLKRQYPENYAYRMDWDNFVMEGSKPLIVLAIIVHVRNRGWENFFISHLLDLFPDMKFDVVE